MKVHSVTPENFGACFLNNDFSEIYNQTTEEFKAIITLEEFQELGETWNAGVAEYKLEMNNAFPGNLTQYIWLDEKREKGIGVAFDEKGIIHRMYIRPFVTFPKSDKMYSKNKYQWPVKEKWFVFWGGTNEFINHHYPHENQRYAYDLVITKDDKSHRGAGRRNEDYYAYGKEILAPASGKVVQVMDQLTDQFPGEMNENNPEGNFIIIQHAMNEYSMLAHLRERSIVVSEGELVKVGQMIGACGNSGNSSEPHLHFQIMDRPDSATGKSTRIRFAGGEELIQGEVTDLSKQKTNWRKRAEQLDHGFFWLDALLFVPRLIMQFFRWLVHWF